MNGRNVVLLLLGALVLVVGGVFAMALINKGRSYESDAPPPVGERAPQTEVDGAVALEARAAARSPASERGAGR